MISPENRNIEGVIAERGPKEIPVKRGKMDMVFFGIIMLLLTVGLIMMFSASYAFAYYNYGNSYKFIIKQAEFAVIGVAMMIIVSYIDYHWYAKFHIPWIVYGLSIIMLVVVLILPPMQEGFDYKRWLYFGGISFQPSEIAKFSIILLFSYLISKKKEKMNDKAGHSEENYNVLYDNLAFPEVYAKQQKQSDTEETDEEPVNYDNVAIPEINVKKDKK